MVPGVLVLTGEAEKIYGFPAELDCSFGLLIKEDVFAPWRLCARILVFGLWVFLAQL
jgi:hypothetical protein